MGHVFTFDKNLIDEKLKEAFGNSVSDIVGFGNIFSSDEGIEEDNIEVAPIPEENKEEEVTPEDRAESTFDMPDEVDTLIKNGAKMAAKEGAKALEKAIDDIFK